MPTFVVTVERRLVQTGALLVTARTADAAWILATVAIAAEPDAVDWVADPKPDESGPYVADIKPAPRPA